MHASGFLELYPTLFQLPSSRFQASCIASYEEPSSLAKNLHFARIPALTMPGQSKFMAPFGLCSWQQLGNQVLATAEVACLFGTVTALVQGESHLQGGKEAL
jgi:hypothetical protein